MLKSAGKEFDIMAGDENILSFLRMLQHRQTVSID
jgi:hypothetical protein